MLSESVRPPSSRVFVLCLVVSMVLHAMVTVPAGVMWLINQSPLLLRLIGLEDSTDEKQHEQAEAAMVRTPPPPPSLAPPPEVRLGIDQSGTESVVWMGFAEQSPHSGPSSEVDQSGMTSKKAGVPDESGAAASRERATEAPATPIVAAEEQATVEPRTEQSPIAETPETNPANTDTPEEKATEPVEKANEPNEAKSNEQPEVAPIAESPVKETPAAPVANTPATHIVKNEAETAKVEPNEAGRASESTNEPSQVEPFTAKPTVVTPITESTANEEERGRAEAERERVKGALSRAIAESLQDGAKALAARSAAAQSLLKSALTNAIAKKTNGNKAPVMPTPASASANGQPVTSGEPGIESDKDSDASSTTVTAEYRNGKVIAGEGLDIKTVRPTFSKYTRVTAIPTNPIVEIQFDRTGKVRDVVMKQSSGYRDVDEPVKNAVWAWTAKGKVLEELASRRSDGVVKVEITILLRG